MIDSDGYRPNVGIVISNAERRLFWARRVGQKGWQFPQGGIREAESPEQALYRELREEVGLQPGKVEVIAQSASWLRYELPEQYRRQDKHPLCIGQKQRWFLLRYLGGAHDIDLNASATPEFDRWEWADYWRPATEVIFFKRDVYRQVLGEFGSILFPDGVPPTG